MGVMTVVGFELRHATQALNMKSFCKFKDFESGDENTGTLSQKFSARESNPGLANGVHWNAYVSCACFPTTPAGISALSAVRSLLKERKLESQAARPSVMTIAVASRGRLGFPAGAGCKDSVSVPSSKTG